MVRFADAVPVEVRPARLAPDKQWTEEDLRHIRDLLSDSVRRHTMSDVPVGVFLSGGLDSAIVDEAVKVADERGERLPTFAVGTEGSADLMAARAVAEYLGTDHHEIVPTAEDLESALDEAVTVIEHFDPALVRSAVPNRHRQPRVPLRPGASPDGLRGGEGTFSLCSFRYVDTLACAGRLDQARGQVERTTLTAPVSPGRRKVS